MTATRILLPLAFLCAGAPLVAAGPFQHSTLELGVYGAYWGDGETVRNGVSFDARLTAQRVLGIQVGYSMVDVPRAAMPERGYALQPDLRAEVVIAPFANPYLSPFVTLGGGIAGYGDGRVSLLGGAGCEITLYDHVALSAVYRVVVPQPFEVAAVVKEEMEALSDKQKADPNPDPNADMPSVGSMIGQHYSLDTYEFTVGVRLVF